MALRGKDARSGRNTDHAISTRTQKMRAESTMARTKSNMKENAVIKMPACEVEAEITDNIPDTVNAENRQ